MDYQTICKERDKFHFSLSFTARGAIWLALALGVLSFAGGMLTGRYSYLG